MRVTIKQILQNLRHNSLRNHIVLIVLFLIAFLNYFYQVFAIINPTFQRIYIMNFTFLIPLLILINGFFLKRKVSKIINSLVFVIPAFIGMFISLHFIPDVLYGFPQTAHLSYDGYEVNSYQSEVWMGGTGCYVYQERAIFPGILLTKRLVGVYRCHGKVKLEKVGEDSVKISGINESNGTIQLKPYIYW